MYKIIRCGLGFDPVIVVTPAEAGPDPPGAKFHRLASWPIGDHKPNVFNEISRETALGYFSGHADGMGFEEFPREPFSTLDELLAFALDKHRESVRAMLAKYKQKEE